MPEWMTYAEAGAHFGVSAEAARQIAFRRKWPRRRPNDAPNGQVQVLVPDDAETRPRTGVGRPNEQPADIRYETPFEHLSDARSSNALDALREVIGALREQLTAANLGRDQAEARAERADGRADRAEQSREAERTRADAERTRAEAAEARAAELHAMLDAAETKAAAMDRAEAERATWSRWRRLREVWRR
jgi:hypothetical protein